MHEKATLLALVALCATACTKTVVLKEDNPVVVTASPPAPPPPPPDPEPEPPKRVEVKKEKIQVNETIHFDFNKATIRADSHDLLDEIAAVIIEHPEVLKIRIEGHTDSIGKAKYNLWLSKNRAKAVRDYLVDKGVASERLETEGYGLSQPIADNDTEEGRAKNRRVEFNILERADDAGETAGDAGETADDAGETAASGAAPDADKEAMP